MIWSASLGENGIMTNWMFDLRCNRSTQSLFFAFLYVLVFDAKYYILNTLYCFLFFNTTYVFFFVYMPSRAAIRSSIGGWVLKSLLALTPFLTFLKGFTM